MLDTIRNNSRSIFIYLIFGVLIAVFIINFGPQSGGGGCSPARSYVAKVNREELSESSWRFAFLALNPGGTSGARARNSRAKETVMDGLLQREMLAEAAGTAGFHLSDDEVESRIAKGEMYILGRRGNGEEIYFQDGHFDYDRLERFVKNLGLANVQQFIDEQRHEMLAEKMREMLRASVRVSPEEVLERYKQQHTQANVEYVKFEPRKIARDLVLSDADITVYAVAHEDDLKKKYELDKGIYKGRKDVRLRQIFIKKPEGESETDHAAAKKAAEAALARVTAGEDFAKVASETSQDETSAKRGGDLGWKAVSALGFGPEFSQAVEGLTAGQTSGLIQSSRGVHLVKVQDRREGDLTYDQVRTELAEQALRDEKSKSVAKADAETSLARALAGAPIDQIFDREGAPDVAAPEPAKEQKGKQLPAEPPPPAIPSTFPRLQEGEQLRRNGAVVSGNGGAYLGKSLDLAKAIFDELKPGQLGPKIYDVDDGIVLVKLISREEPNMQEFEKEKDTLASELAFEKSYRVIDDWADARCRDVKDAIEVNPTFVEYNEVDEKTGTKKKSVAYTPCAGSNPFAGLLPF